MLILKDTFCGYRGAQPLISIRSWACALVCLAIITLCPTAEAGIIITEGYTAATVDGEAELSLDGSDDTSDDTSDDNSGSSEVSEETDKLTENETMVYLWFSAVFGGHLISIETIP